jgi:hypothetical protein
MTWLLLSAERPAQPVCHVVENERIVNVPCSMAEAVAARAEPPRVSDAPLARKADAAAVTSTSGSAPNAVDAASTRAQALERQLAATQRRVQDLEAGTATAEAERAEALEQRAAALNQLAAIELELDAEGAMQQQAALERRQRAEALDATAARLWSVEGDLALGTVESADAILSGAEQALSDAHAPDGTASIAAARYAVSQGDLYAARREVARAIAATAQAASALAAD